MVCVVPTLSIVISVIFQMRAVLLCLAALVAAAVAQQCGQTPIKPNLFVGASAAAQTGKAVIGGQPVNAYSWPWTVAICTNDWFGNCNFQAAGTVIGSQWILTSALVQGSTLAKDYRVQSGVYDESNKHEGTEQVVGINGIFVHPGWDLNHNDIALLQLSTPLRFDQFTQPICLPANDVDQVQPGQYQWFTGWGYTRDFQFGVTTKNLQQAQLYIDPTSVCQSYYANSIYDSQLCVGTPQKTTCNDDVGGPLVQQPKGDGTWFQYGISSYRAKNCDAAAVFTRVSSYCPWITSLTGIQCI
ncbi:hypothetical protein PFISCL1PPCAC_18542 [Pristionchus fissidentatus]|uniref:Peptidase S1 domain-containing protein n=1 Tax=Pristionchus fissidentatus TaxID=1538716 RepID=A0AAV5W670_9BILA|nr:hypothetical protein PFISCL1PPCAC_18542 [Pristionchus fissidentatus]